VSPYLRPTAPIAPDVLLPADPGLAMAVAQRVLTKPAMANHHHGLWGYSGRTGADRELTIQSTGVGAPSAAAVLGELASHGVRRAVRLGRCAALPGGPAPGSVLVIVGAVGADGVSAALGADRSTPDRALTAALEEAVGAAPAVVASADLPASAQSPARIAEWRRDGAVAADLETAGLLAFAGRLGTSAAAAVLVCESENGRLDEAEAEASLIELGAGLTRALSDLPASAAAR
jgi:uridine phosphorylase